MLTVDPTIRLAILRQNLDVVRRIHAAAVKRRKVGLMADEAARIAWIEQHIAELEAEARREAEGVGAA
jgi:hypothetical protein